MGKCLKGVGKATQRYGYTGGGLWECKVSAGMGAGDRRWEWEDSTKMYGPFIDLHYFLSQCKTEVKEELKGSYPKSLDTAAAPGWESLNKPLVSGMRQLLLVKKVLQTCETITGFRHSSRLPIRTSWSDPTAKDTTHPARRREVQVRPKLPASSLLVTVPCALHALGRRCQWASLTMNSLIKWTLKPFHSPADSSITDKKFQFFFLYLLSTYYILEVTIHQKPRTKPASQQL